MLVQDVTRCKNRLKALYRGRGISAAGRAIYQPLARKLATIVWKLWRTQTEFRAEEIKSVAR